MNRATNGNWSSPEPFVYLCIFIILSRVQSWGYDKYMDRGIWCVAIDGNAPAASIPLFLDQNRRSRLSCGFPLAICFTAGIIAGSMLYSPAWQGEGGEG